MRCYENESQILPKPGILRQFSNFVSIIENSLSSRGMLSKKMQILPGRQGWGDVKETIRFAKNKTKFWLS